MRGERGRARITLSLEQALRDVEPSVPNTDQLEHMARRTVALNDRASGYRDAVGGVFRCHADMRA